MKLAHIEYTWHLDSLCPEGVFAVKNPYWFNILSISIFLRILLSILIFSKNDLDINIKLAIGKCDNPPKNSVAVWCYMISIFSNNNNNNDSDINTFKKCRYIEHPLCCTCWKSMTRIMWLSSADQPCLVKASVQRMLHQSDVSIGPWTLSSEQGKPMGKDKNVQRYWIQF